VIEGLDLSAMVKSYRGTGSAGYHPALLLGLLVYGYATGVFRGACSVAGSYAEPDALVNALAPLDGGRLRRAARDARRRQGPASR
jgi:hypothetical protein